MLNYSTNNAEIDLCSCVLRIALANNFAVDSTLILEDFCFRGIVSVTINSSKFEFSIVS